MKNIIRVFVVVTVFSLFASVPFCAAKTAPIQSLIAQDGPTGNSCPPMQQCTPVIALNALGQVWQDGPTGNSCPPMQQCTPVIASNALGQVWQDGPSPKVAL